MATRKAAKAAAEEAPEAEAEAAEPTGPSTKEKVLELVAAGKSRSEIAEELGISYAAVYHHTKDNADVAGGRRGVLVEYDGETMPRAQAMRKDFEAGMSVSDIAKKFDVIYQVAWQATKGKAQADAEEAEAGDEAEAEAESE